MENKGNNGSGSCSRGGLDSQATLSADQVTFLEELFKVCPKPSFFRMLEMVKENPVLSNLNSELIKTWFENRRNGDDGSGSSSIRDFDREVTPSGDQIIVFEKLFEEWPKPSLYRRLQWIHEAPLFSNLDPEQIKAWFEYRRMVQEQTLQIWSENDIDDRQGNSADRENSH